MTHRPTRVRTRLLFAVLLAAFAHATGCSSPCKDPTVMGTVDVVVCQNGEGILVLQGTNFKRNTEVVLVNGTSEYRSASVSVNADGTQLEARIPTGVQPGTTYDVRVENGSCTDAEPHMQVVPTSGVFAFLADPDVVYDGISTAVTVYATSIRRPLPTDAIMVGLDGTTATSPLAFQDVPGRPNRVQVTIPSGTTAGIYDLTITDGSGCSSTIDQAYTVTSTLSVGVGTVDPPFADAAIYASVTINRDTASTLTSPFVATPRVFLNPSAGTGTAIALESVSFLDGDTLTAVVPPGQAPGDYDVIVVNPDGTVGRRAAALRVQTTPPPVVTAATPSSIRNQAGETVVVSGTTFDANPTIDVDCRTTAGASVSLTTTSTAATCAAGVCSLTATIDASVLSSGDVCILRLTNADGSYFDYSAIGITGSSFNLSTPVAGPNMVEPRRALVAAAGNATASSRFVYAIGGDRGAASAATPLASVEYASVDPYGRIGAFALQNHASLSVGRSFAGAVTVGRYIYVVGGNGGSGPLASAERAMILDPVESPRLDVADMIPGTTGLAGSTFVYRVSAVFGASDVDNPNGESLPSDELIVRVPTLDDGRLLSVVLEVDPPRDRLGALIPGVVGYRVYRSPTSPGRSGDAVLLGTIPAGQTRFTDDGTATPGTETPLPIGSLGRWAPLPTMMVAAVPAPREGLGVAAARDPGTAGLIHVYAGFGRSGGTLALGTYTFLDVTEAANGHQTFAGSWTAGTVTSPFPRWQIGTYTADSSVSADVPVGSTYIFFAGGLTGTGGAAGTVEACLVLAGGQCAGVGVTNLLDDSPKDFTSSRAGYGVCGANDRLFAFGGAGGTPSAGAAAAQLESPAPSLANNSWNNEGLSMTHLRYLLGSAVQSAFIFLMGGETDTEAATRSTELVIW